MPALRLYAGPAARRHIQQNGLRPADVGIIPAAAGGPKGLILGPLDRFIFGQWLNTSSQPVQLVGASIGAWRMATACLQQSVAAFERLERDYIAQHYELPPGQKRPSADQVSEQFGHNLQLFYGGRIPEVLQHPRYRLHIVTSHGRHVLGREGPVRTPLGYLGAFTTNLVSRRAMGGWLERVIFSDAREPLPVHLPGARELERQLPATASHRALDGELTDEFGQRFSRLSFRTNHWMPVQAEPPEPAFGCTVLIMYCRPCVQLLKRSCLVPRQPASGAGHPAP